MMTLNFIKSQSLGIALKDWDCFFYRVLFFHNFTGSFFQVPFLALLTAILSLPNCHT